jgi:cytochrome c oxidase subunit 4
VTGHVVSPKLYYGIFTALLVLTVATTAAARFDLGPMNVVIALAIAGCKALLVVLFFMHVRYSKPIVWVAAASGLLWLAIMLALTLTDYYSREWFPAPRGW